MRITITDKDGRLDEVSFEYTDYNDSLLLGKIIEYTVSDGFQKFKKELLQEIEDKQKCELTENE